MALINATWKVTLGGVVLLDWDDFSEGEPRLERGFINERIAALGSVGIINLGRDNLHHTASFTQVRYFDNDDEARSFMSQHAFDLPAAPADCMIELLNTGATELLQNCAITSYNSRVENNFFFADYSLQGGILYQSAVTDEYYDPAYTLEVFPNFSTTPRHEGMSFTASVSGTLNRASFWLSKIGTPTGLISAHLWAHTGTFPATSHVGALLASSTPVHASSLSSSVSQVYFNFPGSTASLVAGTHYIITIEYNNADSTNGINIAMVEGSPEALGHPGAEVEYVGGTWYVELDEDHLFRVEVWIPPVSSVSPPPPPILWGDAGWRLVNVTGPPAGVTLQVKNSSGVWEDVWTYTASS